MKLKNKRAFITGGASGIGKAIAQIFSREGAEVIVFDIQKPDFEVRYIEGDVRKEEDIEGDVRKEEDIEKALSKLKELDILVNSAGVYEPGFVEETTNEQLNKVIDTNFKGTYLMIKHALPLISKSKGNIINIASSLGVNPEIWSPAYCSSKAAVIMLTQCVAQAQGEKLRVNAILPGPIDTPMLRGAFETEEEIKEYAKTNPMKKIGKPEDVAKIALYLSSEDANFVTGATWEVDGGEASSRISP